MEISALVTGEAIAQVSSQTLTNLAVIDEVTETLVLRPLIVMDKTDIINLSRQIGTEEFSANIPEYCGVISRKPTTRAKLDRIVHEESRFDFGKLDAALAARRKVGIEDIVADLDAEVRVEPVTELAPGQVVIDIRHPHEEELRPLLLPDVDVLQIPFYRLNSDFPGLARDRDYLLYCDKGVMSQLHAAHLKDEGYANVGVFRPLLAG
jgi:thiamine biosynthesis protein ThiI